MAITRYAPNTIHLAGDFIEIGDIAASETITPGMGVELFNSSGVIRFRKSTAALAGGLVALNQSMLNQGVDDTYAANDLMQVGDGVPGSTWWMLLASGQNIAAGNRLEHAGDGTLRILAAGVPVFKALENKPTVTALTRVRVEKL